jgi:hypothetical protein
VEWVIATDQVCGIADLRLDWLIYISEGLPPFNHGEWIGTETRYSLALDSTAAAASVGVSETNWRAVHCRCWCSDCVSEMWGRC